MIPHTLVLEPGLVIYKIYNGYWFWGRPSPTTSGKTCARSRANSHRLGPGEPGLRENWEVGDRKQHWPYWRAAHEAHIASLTSAPAEE